MDEPCVLAGSISLALQGVEIHPQDIDILTTKEGAFKINDLLNAWEIKPVTFGCTKNFKSYHGKFSIQGVIVEIMGAFQEKRGEKWVSLGSRLSTPKLVKIAEITLPVSPLTCQLESYKRSERRKDEATLQKIEERLEHNTK